MSKELWDRQAKFTDKALLGIDKDLSKFTEADIVAWTKEYLMYISKEGFEVLDELNWKKHTKEKHDVNKYNVKVELIDMQKYLWGLMHIWGMTYPEFEEIFNNKSCEVEKRWVQNFELMGIESTAKNCIIDIDGVLNYYPDCFYNWVKDEYGIEADILNTNRIEYEKYKDLYRKSGIKRTLNARPESIEALTKLKELGYTIILMTNRPNTEYKNIYFDTVSWLANNNIPYDYLFWSRDHKVVDAFKRTENIKFIIDDSPEICRDFSKMGIKSYYFSNNQDPFLTNRITSILDINELKES